MNGLTIVLCVVAVLSTGSCAVLLFRGYIHQRVRLLMWSSMCFVGLTVNNVALFIDVVASPNVDLRLARLIPALIGVACLLYGFLWDTT